LESASFLQTKLHPTQIADRSLHRGRLVKELMQAHDSRVVLITGPAGSGKSTLVADYLSIRPRRAAWLGLGEEDQDPHLFFRYFLESLCQTYRGCCERTRNQLGDFDLSDPKSLCQSLINEFFAYAEPAAIVLDDYHLVNGQPAVRSFFQMLCRRGPSNLQIIVVSRDLPDLPIAWLRSKRLLGELHYADLRFSWDETVDLLRDIWGMELDSELVQMLLDKTEGWATGLQLAAQAIRGKPIEEVRTRISQLGGGEAIVYEYLASEVLESQSPEVRRFLQYSALPEVVNQNLLRALLPQVDVAQMLEFLEGARIFLFKLDREGDWYRYHHLFRDFLRSSLTRECGTQLVERLHREIADWLRAHGELVACIPHYLKSGDPILACEMLESVGSELLHRGLKGSLSRWMEALPLPLRSGRPGLQVVQAELNEMQGHWPKAVEGYRQALQEYRKRDEHAQVATVLQKLSLCYIKYGESKQLLETCEEGLRLCPAEQVSLRSMLHCWMGSTLVNCGQDWELGYDLIQKGYAAAIESGDPGAISWGVLTYGFGYHFPQGNFTEALRTLNEGIDLFTRLDWPIILYQLVMNKALVLIVMGQHSRAQDLVDETLIQAKRAGHTYVEKGLEILRAMAYLEGRSWQACQDTMSRVSQSEIPAQFKPYYFRNRMLFHGLQQNFDQARVDQEEMQRALLLNGAGIYALECTLSQAFLSLNLGLQGDFQHLLHQALELCQRARSKFWEMKALQVQAWAFWLHRQEEGLKDSLMRSLQLAKANRYDEYWLSDPWQIGGHLLILAASAEIESNYVERLLLRFDSKLSTYLEELVQDPDIKIRKVAVHFLASHSSDRNRAILKTICCADPDQELQEVARQAWLLGRNSCSIEIRALGKLSIYRESEELDYGKLLRPMALRLLKYFLVHGSKLIASERIMDLFWPEVDPEKARHTLNAHLSSVRRSLGIPHLFQRVGDSYRLGVGDDLQLDSLDYEELALAGLDMAKAKDRNRALNYLESAELRYRGPFLEEELYEEWVEARRQELAQLHERSLEALGDLYHQLHNYDQAIQRYRRLLAGEEPREHVFPKLFRCLEALGDHQAIRREFELLRNRLRNSLGVEPQASTRALLESLTPH